MSALAEVFDVEPVEIATSQVVIPASGDNTEDTDFDSARANTYELIDMTKAALNTAIRVAGETENPRALEVLGQLLKTASEINRQLIVMNKDKADVKTAKGMKQTNQLSSLTGQNSVVFTGTAMDLAKIVNGT